MLSTKIENKLHGETSYYGNQAEYLTITNSLANMRYSIYSRAEERIHLNIFPPLSPYSTERSLVIELSTSKVSSTPRKMTFVKINFFAVTPSKYGYKRTDVNNRY